MRNHLDWGSTQERGSKAWVESSDPSVLRLKWEEEKMRKERWSGRTLVSMGSRTRTWLFLFTVIYIWSIFLFIGYLYLICSTPIHISSHKNIKLISNIYIFIINLIGYGSFELVSISNIIHIIYRLKALNFIWLKNIFVDLFYLLLMRFESGLSLNQPRTYSIYIHLCKI